MQVDDHERQSEYFCTFWWIIVTFCVTKVFTTCKVDDSTCPKYERMLKIFAMDNDAWI